MGFTQSVQLDNVEFPDVDSMVDHFTNAVVQAAGMNIPRSSIRPRRVPVPWWTDECRDAIRVRKRALKQFQIHPIQEKLVSFKCLSAAARRTIRSAKKKFVGGLRFVFVPFNTIRRRVAKATPYFGKM
jgi:hypothetical protein